MKTSMMWHVVMENLLSGLEWNYEYNRHDKGLGKQAGHKLFLTCLTLV